MNIQNKFANSIAIGLLIPLIGIAPVAFADLVDNSENSVNVWFAEGNSRCSDYFGNNYVLEMSTSSISITGGTLTGPDNPLDGNTDPESLDYSITGSSGGEPTEISFSSTTKINAVILKQGRSINFYTEPTGGIASDATLDLDTGVIDGAGRLDIAAMSFCYGASFDTTIAPTTLSACDLTSPTETYCQEGEAFECNVDNGRLDCCSCNGDKAGCFLDAPEADGGCGSITFEELYPAFTGVGSEIVCYPINRRLTCWCDTDDPINDPCQF